MPRKGGIRVLDLFCGGGGSSCGARLAGATPVGGVDIWPMATETYGLNNPQAMTYTADLTNLRPRDLVAKLGRVDLLLGSPECTSHSVAKGGGKRSDRSQLMAFQVIRFAKAIEPTWVIVENVVKMQDWDLYDKFIDDLRSLGYHLREARLEARDFNVAQSRKRLFVICDLHRDPVMPRTYRSKKSVLSILQKCDRNGREWRFSPLRQAGRAPATLERAQRAIDVLGSRESFIVVYYGTDGAGGWQTLDRPLRTITTLDRFALVRPNGNGHEMRMLQPPELA